MLLGKLSLKKIEGDASFRKFYRKKIGDKKSIIVFASKKKKKKIGDKKSIIVFASKEKKKKFTNI